MEQGGGRGQEVEGWKVLREPSAGTRRTQTMRWHPRPGTETLCRETCVPCTEALLCSVGRLDTSLLLTMHLPSSM